MVGCWVGGSGVVRAANLLALSGGLVFGVVAVTLFLGLPAVWVLVVWRLLFLVVVERVEAVIFEECVERGTNNLMRSVETDQDTEGEVSSKMNRLGGKSNLILNYEIKLCVYFISYFEFRLY